MIACHRAALAAALMLAAAPAAAQPQPDQEPLRIVRAFYAPYLANRSDANALDLIRAHATPELQRLIDRENACVRRTQGICAVDYDVLVDGQDFKISALQVTAQNARPGAMSVRAAFRNFNRAKAVDFSFAITGGRWLLSDVTMTDGARRLTTLLKTNR
jgi:hypothetical protein